MLSRIFWVGLAGIALVTGMILQDSDGIFSWGHDDRRIDTHIDRAIDASAIDSVIDRSVDRMEIVGADGREIDVPTETKRALGNAVAALVKAEADLAILRVRDGSSEERQKAEVRRAEARAEVDRLKAVIKGEEAAVKAEQDALSQQIERDVREQVREEIRAEVRDAVRN